MGIEALHPFAPLQPEEIKICSKLIKDNHNGSKVQFRFIERNDPPKSKMLQYIAAERAGSPLPYVPRTVTVMYYVTDEDKLLRKVVINTVHKQIVQLFKLPKGVVGPAQPEDMIEQEYICLNHPIVKQEIEKLKLPAGYEVISDPWIYGTDDPKEDRLLLQHYMYLKCDHPEANHYSLPLKFSPVFDVLSKEFVRMDYLPGGADATTVPTQPYPGYKAVEYHKDLISEPERPIKPLTVDQPEGPSFTVRDNVVEWQKWKFRVSTNCREGCVLYDVTFDGRDVFYRMSLSEMTVPYGDPRAPFHRKQAFDLGDVGFGVCANQLKLGCDCLGYIHYFDGHRIDIKGDPVFLDSIVCLHEQDNGLLMKHVNYRNDKAYVTRRRELVVQTIATVSNYEYIVEYIFDQAAGITIQIRATGILSTMPIDDDVVVPWGTNVGPGVMAAYHQHLLSFRFDTAVDGHKNTLVYDDAVPMSADSPENKYKVGYVTKRHVVEKAGSCDGNPFAARAFTVINENKINPVSKRPVGYRIKVPAAQGIIAAPESFNTKRAKFATKPYWVTKYADDTLYAAGEFTNQSKEDTGLAVWANGVDNVRDEDIVVWATLGFTHVPRPEDFPVMPVEMHQIHIFPVNFFEKNPALDVPQSDPKKNKSVLVNSTNAEAAGTSSCCTKM